MIGSFFAKFDALCRPSLPLLTGVVFVLLSAAALPIPYIASIIPVLGLMPVYYWAIYRPDLLRALFVFFLGLLHDFVHLQPIGVSAIIFVLIYQLALTQRRFFIKQIFFMLWIGFGVVIFLAAFLNWGLLSLYNLAFIPVLPVVMQAVMGVAVFPFPAWVLIKIQRAFLSQGGEVHVS